MGFRHKAGCRLQRPRPAGLAVAGPVVAGFLVAGVVLAPVAGGVTAHAQVAGQSQARPPSAPAPSSRARSSGFRGVYEFGGGEPADAGRPHLAGAVLNFYWAQLEPAPGQFNWSVVDNAMAPWVSAGKKVVLRFATAGEVAWGPFAGNATPAWVYAGGVGSVTETDGSVIPLYWDPAFQSDYRSFVSAAAARYDGNPSIAFVEDGVGDGGESLVDTYSKDPDRLARWQNAGYSDGLWYTTVRELIGDYMSQFHRTPTVPMLDSTFLGPSRPLYYAKLLNWLRSSSPRLWLQFNGLTPTSQLPAAQWAGAAVRVAEQRGPASSGVQLAAECHDGVENLHASYLLLYGSDVDNPALQSQLAECEGR